MRNSKRKFSIFVFLLFSTIINSSLTPSSANNSVELLTIPSVSRSTIELVSNLKLNSIARFKWTIEQLMPSEIYKNEGMSVYDYYSFKTFKIDKVQKAWVEENVFIFCANGSQRSSASNFFRKQSLIGFSPKEFPVRKGTFNDIPVIDLEFKVTNNCRELKIESSIWLFVEATILTVNSQSQSRELILFKESTENPIFIGSPKGNTESKASPSSKANTKVAGKTTPGKVVTKPTVPAKSMPKPKDASPNSSGCKSLISQKILATYGMADPPFGVTTIKFANTSNCSLFISISGDFIGSSDGIKYRCPVIANWTLDANSRIEFAPPGTVVNTEPFQSVFPQLRECPGSLNAQKNFIATIWASNP